MANTPFATAPSKNASVGADAYIGPPYNRCTPCPCVGAGFYPARRLIPPIGADASACPSPRAYTALAIKCHCKARARTGCGERAERCQWQEKRGERVAAVKISSVRRKAAQKFWAPQQGHPHPPSPKKRSCTPVQERFTLYYKLSINPSPYCCPSWANTTSAARKNFSAAWS